MSRAVLTYHSIDASGSPISVAPDVFARHVAWLASGRVAVEPLTTLLAVETPAGDGRPRVALTFDDAFANFSALAWPQLRDARLPATVFVVSGHVGRTNRWGDRQAPGVPELPLADWDALASAAADGATIGAHSRTHPLLPTLTPAAIGDELDGCLEALTARLGRRPEAFAYPYGALDDATVVAVASRFRVACTTEHRPVDARDSVHRVPRLDMYYFQGLAALDDWGEPSWTRRIALRRAARAVRRGLVSLRGQ